jgi:hypothetical protein
MITETDFLVGLTWIKAKTLCGIRSGSRVRSGPDQVTGLRHFPWLGLDGLSSGKSKTLSRLVLALSLNPDRVSWVRGLPLTSTSYKFKSSMIQIQI